MRECHPCVKTFFWNLLCRVFGYVWVKSWCTLWWCIIFSQETGSSLQFVHPLWVIPFLSNRSPSLKPLFIFWPRYSCSEFLLVLGQLLHSSLRAGCSNILICICCTRRDDFFSLAFLFFLYRDQNHNRQSKNLR